MNRRKYSVTEQQQGGSSFELYFYAGDTLFIESYMKEDNHHVFS